MSDHLNIYEIARLCDQSLHHAQQRRQEIQEIRQNARTVWLATLALIVIAVVFLVPR